MALPCGLCRARSRNAGSACLVPRKTPGQIDGDKPMPFLEARLLDALAEKDAGIVDENVEPAELRDSWPRLPRSNPPLG